MQNLFKKRSYSYHFDYKILLFLIILFFPIAGFIHESLFSTAPSSNHSNIPFKEISKGWYYAWHDQNIKESDYLANGDTLSTEIPWKFSEHPINPPERNGRNILWLKYQMPDTDWELPTILMTGKGALLTFKVFMDERLIYSFGKMNSFGEGHLSGVTSHLISLDEDFKGKQLTLKIFSDYANIGIRGKVFIGSRPDLLEKIIKGDIYKFVLGLFMVLIGCIDIFIYKEDDKGIGPVSMFGVLALSLGFYTVSVTAIKDIVIFAPVFWFNMYITTLAIMPIGAMGFLWQTFRPVKGNYIYRIWQFHVGYAIICQAVFFLILYSFLPMAQGSFVLQALRLCLMFDACLMIGIAAKDSLIKNSHKARIYLLGILPVAICGIHDLLVGLDKVKSVYSYFPFALILFVLSLEIIQRRKNVKTQRKLFNYSKKLEKKSKEKEALITDLHDGIGGLITNIKFLSELGLNNSTIEGTKETLSSISALSSDSLSEISNFMQSLDEEVEWETIATSFHTLGNKMLSPLGVSYSFKRKIDETAKKPESILFLNLLRIYKEALTNITKHAKANSVLTKLNVNSENIYLSIEDNGMGFGADIIKGHGLKSMKARAQKLGGTLSVNSENGTLVCFELNLIESY